MCIGFGLVVSERLGKEEDRDEKKKKREEKNIKY